MGDYIDRESYCKTICRCDREYCDKEKCQIWTAPVADVRQVVRGRWEWMGPCRDSGARLWATCTACGLRQRLGDFTMFCPNCGADMKGE